MFLYEKKDKTIDVFSLSQNSNVIRNYKIEQMKKIPPNERGLYTEEIVSSFTTPVSISIKKNIYTGIVPSSELIGENKSLNYNNDIKDVEDLLQWFYYERYNDRPVAKVEHLNKLKYLLIASNYISMREVNGKKIMKIEDIIEIPKSLYLLQLLQQENFIVIKDEDFSEQLNLFNFSYINQISLDELEKMDNCGITENAYSKTINKANNDEHILKLLKK